VAKAKHVVILLTPLESYESRYSTLKESADSFRPHYSCCCPDTTNTGVLLSWQSEDANNIFNCVILAHMRSYWEIKSRTISLWCGSLLKQKQKNFIQSMFQGIPFSRHTSPSKGAKYQMFKPWTPRIRSSAVVVKAIAWKRASLSCGIYQTDRQKLLPRFPTGKRPILVRYRGASSRFSFHCCNYGIYTGGRRYSLWGTSTTAEDTLHVSRKCRCTIILAQLPVHQY